MQVKNYFGHEVKIQLVREDKPVKAYRITNAEDVYQMVRDELANLDREAFLVISLDTRNNVLGINLASLGSVNSSLVHPREVFKSAILLNASGLILVHNHPSGETRPSKEDLEITRRIGEAGRLLGIEVIDHLIVGDKFFSFLENNLLARQKGGGINV